MIVRAVTPDHKPVTLNVQPGSVTVAFDEQTVLAYDRAGRLWSAFFYGSTFRRGLDGGILGKWTQQAQRRRARLWTSEANLVVNRAADLIGSLADGATFEAEPAAREEVMLLLDRARHFTAAAARKDAARFLQVYKPIGILPPDQYMALVLQMTEGCSFNTCTFCTFYRDRPFRIKTPDEFRAHIRAVRAYLGESLALRKTVFLADANALVVPQKQLVALLGVVRSEMADLPPRRLFAFLDGFSGRKKSPDDYVELAALGLRRVYIGLESGHDPLLRWLHKPGHVDDAIQAARAIKAGGVNVCVIVLLGAGGVKFSEGHVRDTVAAINAMNLGAGDLIYFSEFVALHDQPYGQVATHDRIEPLSVEQMRAQRHEIELGFKFAGAPPKLATYDIREFVY